MLQDQKTINIKSIAFLIPSTIHIILSFFYESIIFSHDLLADTAHLDRSGILGTFFVSKLIGALLICLIWLMVFNVFQKKHKPENIILFSSLFIITAAAIFIMYPAMFSYEMDNYFNYTYATMYYPTYWHHYLTGCVYAGALMVFPHPVIIPLLQAFFFVAVITYIFSNLKTTFGNGYQYLTLIFLLIPEQYYVLMNPLSKLYVCDPLFIYIFRYTVSSYTRRKAETCPTFIFNHQHGIYHALENRRYSVRYSIVCFFDYTL